MNGNDIQELREITDRLRADLSATWLALAAMQSVLTPEQQQTVKAAMATGSAKKQALYDAPRSTPQAQAIVEHYRQQMQAAEERLYEVLQGAWLQPPARGS